MSSFLFYVNEELCGDQVITRNHEEEMAPVYEPVARSSVRPPFQDALQPCCSRRERNLLLFDSENHPPAGNQSRQNDSPPCTTTVKKDFSNYLGVSLSGVCADWSSPLAEENGYALDEMCTSASAPPSLESASARRDPPLPDIHQRVPAHLLGGWLA